MKEYYFSFGSLWSRRKGKISILCEECYDRNTIKCHENRGGEIISLPEWYRADLLEKMVNKKMENDGGGGEHSRHKKMSENLA